MRQRTLLGLLGALALVAPACSGGDGDGDTAAPETVTVVETRAATGESSPGGSFEAIPEIVDRVEPSLVSVVTDSGEGSGVVWDDAGTIVTNWHVIEGADDVTVVLLNGSQVDAEVQAATEDFDLAVLRVDREGLPAATFADELPDVGELAIAMGNPLGFEQSVTAGIVSGLHRQIPSGGQTRALVDLLQTDAPISPGNSGGALVDGNGEVIGINVAYLPPSQTGAVAIGFAIPAPTVRRVVEQLLRTGRVQQAYLGVVPVQVTPELSDELGVDSGVALESVAPERAAERAGLRPGDVIVRFGSRRVATVEDLFAALRTHRPGERVQVTAVRDGERRTLSVTLDEKP